MSDSKVCVVTTVVVVGVVPVVVVIADAVELVEVTFAFSCGAEMSVGTLTPPDPLDPGGSTSWLIPLPFPATGARVVPVVPPLM